jgi:hypothetical protein
MPHLSGRRQAADSTDAGAKSGGEANPKMTSEESARTAISVQDAGPQDCCWEGMKRVQDRQTKAQAGQSAGEAVRGHPYRIGKYSPETESEHLLQCPEYPEEGKRALRNQAHPN